MEGGGQPSLLKEFASYAAKRIMMVGGILLGTAVLFFGALYFLGDPCGNEVVREVVSPDGKQKIVIFERSCGATTDFSTQISIMKARKNLGNAAGNIFVADSNSGAVRVNGRGVIDADARWIDPNTVEISYPSGSRVFERHGHAGNVIVRYTAK